MKLHLLGTAGYHPTQRRHTACLMLPEVGLVLDAGTAMFRIRDLIQTRHLDIFLTHTHLDHVGRADVFARCARRQRNAARDNSRQARQARGDR